MKYKNWEYSISWTQQHNFRQVIVIINWCRLYFAGNWKLSPKNRIVVCSHSFTLHIRQYGSQATKCMIIILQYGISSAHLTINGNHLFSKIHIHQAHLWHLEVTYELFFCDELLATMSWHRQWSCMRVEIGKILQQHTRTLKIVSQNLTTTSVQWIICQKRVQTHLLLNYQLNMKQENLH